MLRGQIIRIGVRVAGHRFRCLRVSITGHAILMHTERSQTRFTPLTALFAACSSSLPLQSLVSIFVRIPERAWTASIISLQVSVWFINSLDYELMLETWTYFSTYRSTVTDPQ